MRIVLLSLYLLLAPPQLRAAESRDFAAFAAAYRAATPSARAELADDYLAHLRTYPIIDGRDAVLLFRGSGEARAIGEFKCTGRYSLNWSPEGIPFVPLADGGDLQLARIPLEADARVEYSIAQGKADAPDPLNPRVTYNGVRDKTVSEIAMPGFAFPGLGATEPVAQGTVQALSAEWAKPAVTVYLPAGYKSSHRYPVIYTADGPAWAGQMALPTTLDHLIARGRIPPVIAVMIAPAEDRNVWYTYNPEFLAYLDKVIRHVDREYSTLADANHRYHFGSSAGGRAAIYAAFERPDLIANLALFSPALAGPVNYLEPYLAGRKRPSRKLRVWISAGSYEPGIAEDARMIERRFRRWRIPTRATYVHEGHSLQAWRYEAPLALEYFLSD